MIAVSCVWRVVSFKHTHLVERIGLLTLIIMGEGIIGLGDSVSTILQNSVSVSPSAIGTIMSGVLLIVSVGKSICNSWLMGDFSTSCGCFTLIKSSMTVSARFVSKSGLSFIIRSTWPSFSRLKEALNSSFGMRS